MKSSEDIRESVSTTSRKSTTSVSPLRNLTKKEVKRLRIEQTAQLSKLKELMKTAATMKADYIKQRQDAIKNAVKERQEQEKRGKLLKEVMASFDAANRRLSHELLKLRKEESWERYKDPENLPRPEDPPNMNTHMYLWAHSPQSEHFPLAIEMCQRYFGTLRILEDFIDESLDDGKLDIYKETRDEWQAEFMKKLDLATYNIIRRLEVNFNKKDFNQAEYAQETEDVKLSMWTWVDPVGFRERRDPPSIYFPEMGVTIDMPVDYRKNFILRLIHISMDFLSHQCPLHETPFFPVERNFLEEATRRFNKYEQLKMQLAERDIERMKQAKLKVRQAISEARKFESILHAEGLKTSESHLEELEEPLQAKPKKLKKQKFAPSDRNLVVDTSKMAMAAWNRIREEVAEDKKLSLREFRASYSEFGSDISKSFRKQVSIDAGSHWSGDATVSSVFPRRSTEVEGEGSQRINFFRTGSMELKQRPSGGPTPVRIIKDLTEDNESDVSSLKSDSLDLVYGDNYDAEYRECKSLKALIRATTIAKDPPPAELIEKKAKSPKKRKNGKLRDDDDKSIKEVMYEWEAERDSAFVEAMAAQPPEPGMISPRAYTILNGIYYLDIIQHVPQPVVLKNFEFLQYQIGAHNITKEEFRVDYPVDPVGLEKLIRIELPFPQGIYYDVPPKIVVWDEEAKFWSTDPVYKLEHADFESHTSCYLSSSGPIGFAFRRFTELPYLGWNLAPSMTGGINFELECQNVTFNFNFKGNKVCLKLNDGNRGHILVRDIIWPFVGKYVSPPKLIKHLRSVGLDIFPDVDSFTYVEQNSVKDPVLEQHCYFCLAIFATMVEFGPIKWNQNGGFGQIMFSGREFVDGQMVRRKVFCAAKDRSTVHKINLDADLPNSSFVDDSIQFCPDLLTLFETVFNRGDPYRGTSAAEVVSIYYFLLRTRVFSYSGFIGSDDDIYSHTSSTYNPNRSRSRRKKRKNRSSRQSVGTTVTARELHRTDSNLTLLKAPRSRNKSETDGRK